VEPLYWPTYAMAAWSIFITLAGFCGVLGLFFATCMQIAAQFDVLSARLKNLVQREVDDGPSTSEGPSLKLNDEQNKIVHEKLKDIVKQHGALIELCDLIAQSFSWIITFHFISAALQICPGVLLLFLVDGVEWLEFFVATLAMLVEAFTFAYAGQAIINSSSRLQRAAYNFEWYKCDAKNRKMILLIMTGAQKKICMKASFFEVSLESFVTVRT